MSLINDLREESNKVDNKNRAVADEIVEYFRKKFSSKEYEKTVETIVKNRKENLLNRRCISYVEFWQYSSGCSPTNFHALGITWNNPENPYGYESDSYKGVRLWDIQNDVGPRILSMLRNRLEEFGFSVCVENDETWMKLYRKKITLTW